MVYSGRRGRSNVTYGARTLPEESSSVIDGAKGNLPFKFR